MNRLHILITISSLCAIILGTPAYLRAESDGFSVGIQDTDITINTVPQNPQPYQNVTVELSSYSTDLSKALIEWHSGKSIVLSGYGKTSYSFRASGPNTTLVFDIIITTNSGDRVSKRISISPSEISLLWEAVDGYTPPFYRGKAFVSSGGTIRAVAIPNTNTIKQGKGNVSYKWELNGKAVTNASGFNKDSFEFHNNELDTTESIDVVASAVNNTYNAEQSIEVPIVVPNVLFYKKSPTEGILYNSALANDTFVNEDEMTLVAEPYNLAIKGNESDFSYMWQINGDQIDTPAKKTELTIRPTSRDGYATIDVIFENMGAFFQKVSGELKIDL